MSVLWFGPTIYTLPIKDSSVLNKIRYFSKHLSLYILALTPQFRPKFTTYQKTRFYLLPKIPLITYIIQIVVFPIILTILVIKYRIKLLSSQGVIVHGLISIIVKKILSMLEINMKVLIDIHGEWEKTPFLYRGKDPSGFGSKFIKRVGNYVLTNADAIRVNSKYLHKKVTSITSKPLYILPMYIDTEFFLEIPAHGQISKKNLILFAGGLYYLKGVQYLILAMTEIVKSIKNVKLVIAGEGPYKRKLFELIKKKKLHNSVHFTGHISRAHLRELIYGCSVVVLPSLSEGLGRILIEAMTCQKPVIASKVGGIPEIVKNNYNGLLVPPADSTALQSKIIFLLTHPEISEKLGKNGRKFVIKNFSEKFLLKRYVEVYKKVLRG